MKGIEPFDASDELCLSELHAPVRTLLETRFTGKVPGFDPPEWNHDAPRPVMYLHDVGQSHVLYLSTTTR